MKRVLVTLQFLLVFLLHFYGQEYRYLEDKSGLTGVSAANGIGEPVTIKIIYDNYCKINGLAPDWGYAMLINGLKNVILFDTGAKPDIFESNFRKMNLDAFGNDFFELGVGNIITIL
jgi:hypothetical protein